MRYIHFFVRALLVIILLAPALGKADDKTSAANKPPQVQSIRGLLKPPVTTYTVTAGDPEGVPLTFTWENRIACGVFTSSTTSTVSWSHPEGSLPEGCPHEDGTSHDGTITVHISDGAYTVTCAYEGSETGVGSPCVTKEVVAAESATVTADNQSNSVEKSSDSSWSWLVVVLVLVVAAGVVYAARRKKSKRPCEEEEAAEAMARAKLNQAEQAFDTIDRLHRALLDAQAQADKAAKDAEAAVRAAGKKWTASGSTDWAGAHIELSREDYHNKEAGARAEAALQQAAAAREAATNARTAYEAAGGAAKLQQLKSALDAAQAAWEKAAAALRVCLLQATPGASGQVTGGASQPQGPTGPVTAGPSQPSSSFVCNPGDRRNDQVESITITLLDLESVVLKQDKIYSDAGNEAMKFVDYLQTLKDLFSLGKQIKGGVSAYFGKSLTGAADAVSLPDFLTWYDKGIDELTKSMHKLFAIMKDKQRLGDYWLVYRTKQITLTCTRSEVCVNNAWVKECTLTVTDLGSTSHRTPAQQVHLIQELQPAITRLFNQLRNRYTPDRNRAKQFTSSCKL